MYFIQVPFQPDVSKTFASHHAALMDQHDVKFNEYLEKDTVAWFSKEKITHMINTGKRNKFRPHFRSRIISALKAFPFPKRCYSTNRMRSETPTAISATTYKDGRHRDETETSGRLLLYLPTTTVCASSAAYSGAKSCPSESSDTDTVRDGVVEDHGSVSDVPPGFEACDHAAEKRTTREHVILDTGKLGVAEQDATGS